MHIGIALATVANGLVLLVFSYGWSLQEPGIDRDFGWGFPWVGSAGVDGDAKDGAHRGAGGILRGRRQAE